ncbi:MAG TPA: hypothetical protein VK983_02355 [Candidatus Limnocylindrales bacterium]|nr:hypothetical protein [Candidatus Limnocylindrales bacterium]
MRKHLKPGFTAATAGLSALALVSMPLGSLASASQNNNTGAASAYTAHLEELNNSGVSGQAHLNYEADTLGVTLHANGTTPNQTHPMHIHGKDHPEVAFCPTSAQDVNEDGFVSVIEGAATYGPIKLNLTSPQTPFGPPPTPALFTPFAGTPDPSTFPKADENGTVSLSEHYVFDGSPEAQAALQSITPLENQHIVLHGAPAPASVDADAFAILGAPVTGSLDEVIYDTLLPVACGEIQQTTVTAVEEHQDQNTPEANQGQDQGQGQGAASHASSNTAAVDAFHARLAVLEDEYHASYQTALATFEANREANHDVARNELIATFQAAHDRFVNQFFEARNQLVDQLNQSGETELRDEVTRVAEQKLQQISHDFEAAKHEAAHIAR